MTANGDIYLGEEGDEEFLTPLGRTLKITEREISKQDDAASGMTRKDIVAIKTTFTIEYTEIDGTNLEMLLDLYNSFTILSLLLYTDEDEYDQYDVIMSSIDRTRITHLGGGYWSGVSIVLDRVD